jgi:hypothetical protein
MSQGMAPVKTTRISTDKRRPKKQLKVQIDFRVHGLLKALCAKSRRNPAGQIEFMTIMFHRHDLERRMPPV